VTRQPDFDDLVGSDISPEERERLRHAHDLLVQAGPPPELSPELESVPWPDDALAPLWGRRAGRRPAWQRPVVLAAALATAAVLGFLLGNSTGPGANSINAVQTLKLHGTALEPAALATLEIGDTDRHGNYRLVLHVEGLPKLKNGGYYDLYLTKRGKALVSCGTFNADGETVVPMTAAYNLDRFDKNGFVIVRKTPGHFEPTDVVLRATA
jgi:hypothetical protein